MKFLVVFAAVLAVSAAQQRFGQPFSSFGRPTPAPSRPRPAAPVAARVSSNDQNAQIVRYDSDINPDGSYSYALETDNGIAAQAQGSPRDFGGNPPVVPVVSQGSFSWTSPEGEPISITYVADENGYQPQGSALPVAPPVPPQIARALEYILKNQKK